MTRITYKRDYFANYKKKILELHKRDVRNNNNVLCKMYN